MTEYIKRIIIERCVHRQPHYDVLIHCVNIANLTTVWTLQYSQQGLLMAMCVSLTTTPTSPAHERVRTADETIKAADLSGHQPARDRKDIKQVKKYVTLQYVSLPNTSKTQKT